MKIKTLLSLYLLLCSINFGYAQAHNYGGNYNCKLKPGNFLNSEKHPCPACEAQEKRIRDAKMAEEKIRSEKAIADAKLKKEALEKSLEAKRLSDAKKSKSTAVYINMPSSKPILPGKTSSTSASSKSNASSSLSVSSSSSSNSSSSSSDSSSSTKEESTKEVSSPSYYGNYVPPKTKQEQFTDLANNTSKLFNNIASDMEENRIRKEEQEKRIAEQRSYNKAYGNKLIAENSSKALRYGDENAIQMTYKGYMNINKVATEEGNDKEAIAFLEKINSNFNSAFAKKQLVEDYSRTIHYYDQQRNRRTRRTIIHSAIGAGLIAGAFSPLGDEIMKDEMLGSDTGAIVLTGVSVFGAYMVFSGIFNSFMISDYGKSTKEYKSAKDRLDGLAKKELQISFSPGYDYRTNNMMLGLNVGF